MKQGYKLVPIVLFIVGVLFSGSLKAQDTLVVEWLNEAQTEVLRNSLYETILADTTAEGERVANRVYKLRQGGFYYIQESIQNNGWHLNIVGEPGDPSDEAANPPMLQITTRLDGNTPGKMFNIRGDFTLKNVILNGKTTDGGLQYEIIDVRYDNGQFTFDNVIFEYAQWGIIGFYSPGADIYYTNNLSRNFLNESQPWGGRGFSVWSDADTIWVENNTFHNVGFTTIQVEGASANFVWFNHNTIVNNGRQLMLWNWVKEGYFTNNLILNPFWQGEDASQISAERLASDDQQYSGLFVVDPIPSQYGLDAQRKFVIANNAFHLEEEYDTYFTTDNDTFDIRRQPLVSVEVENFFGDYDNMVIKDNMFDQGEPGFGAYADNHAERINFATDLRNGVNPPRMYYWDPNRLASNESIQWPLPDDLAYTDAAYMEGGVTGYPMGDLNWFPSEKSDWQANKDAEAQAILDQVGPAPEVVFQGTLEGESGIFTGDAEVASAPDRNLARIEAGGNIVWEGVDVTAGSYDLVVSHRTWYADGSVARQTDLVVNGGASTPIQIGVEQDGTTWSRVKVEAVALDASNTIALNKSWGYMEYEFVQILEAGTDTEVMKLWPGEADLVGGGSFLCSDAEGTCARGDGFAALGSGGSASYTYDAPGTGSYVVRLNAMLTAEGSSDFELFIDDVSYGTATITGNVNSIQQIDFSGVNLSLGSNEVKITSTGSVGVDFVDFFSVGTLSTPNETEEKAEGFELSQNYPNPFNPSTNINFTLPIASDVQLTVFNLLGQKVATLISEKRAAGNHTVRFDARSLSSGIYFYQLKAGNFTLQRKMTLIK
tara:strand:+ start:42189 stop:44672 length:2484 start_codon:yes stop_codon:yes gene_type:complete